MTRTVALGITQFEDIITKKVFYVDKSCFIEDWWNSYDGVTLITRPRRFGKTLTLNMVETFFSVRYAGRGDLFQHLDIWKNEEIRQLQGTYPVINISFADVKQDSYQSMAQKMKRLLASLYLKHKYLLEATCLDESEKRMFRTIVDKSASDEEYMEALLRLSEYMQRYYGRKVLILVDEYDTPMLEAYTAGYWNEAIVYIRRMFHATFKDNPYLERGLMIGITKITQESVFSDLNNLKVVTTTTSKYEKCFGFTEDEVFDALKEYDLYESREQVKAWYDGFQFGRKKDIYNPWSILNYLSEGEFKPYWMNTSANALVSNLVKEGSLRVKADFEKLIKGESIVTQIDENITYAQLRGNTTAVWSWFLTTGYLKIVERREEGYEVALTNYEVRKAFAHLIKGWFMYVEDDYSSFRQMLLEGRVEEMQHYMSKICNVTFSYFDVGNGSTESEKVEQFYHGFTIGLIADLQNTHILTSNRESGYGRYDVCIEPKDKSKDGLLIEFKVFDEKKESSLEDTARRALEQIEEKNYEADLLSRGIRRVRKYGFAFQGKNVLIQCGL